MHTKDTHTVWRRVNVETMGGVKVQHASKNTFTVKDARNVNDPTRIIGTVVAHLDINTETQNQYRNQINMLNNFYFFYF